MLDVIDLNLVFRTIWFRNGGGIISICIWTREIWWALVGRIRFRKIHDPPWPSRGFCARP